LIAFLLRYVSSKRPGSIAGSIRILLPQKIKVKFKDKRPENLECFADYDEAYLFTNKNEERSVLLNSTDKKPKLAYFRRHFRAKGETGQTFISAPRPNCTKRRPRAPLTGVLARYAHRVVPLRLLWGRNITAKLLEDQGRFLLFCPDSI